MNPLNILKRKRQTRKLKIARIVFNDMFEIVPIDGPAMKTIKLFDGTEYLGSHDYSDVIVEELMENGFLVRNETTDIASFVSKRIRGLGEVQFG